MAPLVSVSWRVGVCAILLSLSSNLFPASAQKAYQPPTEVGLTGTLARIARTGVVTIGYRESSVPFSYLDRAGRPVGYSIDLCSSIVEEVGRTLGRDDIKIAYRKVTSEDRLRAVADGSVDLECGSTTANLERGKVVSFSSMIFVAGTRVLVPKGTPWKDFRSLSGKRIAVTTGTTNKDALEALNRKFNLGVALTEVPDHEQGYQSVVDGKVDGFATDDVLLAGLLAQHKSGDRYVVTGELLSYEAYGIAYARGDTSLRQVIDRAFRTIVVNNELDPLYAKWFLRRLPNGERFNIPMPPQVREAFGVLATELEPEPN
ncbi:MAG: amino acid ABC transporter substrate-binding protein [Hyphomicrobiales bacterium]|nr:MAG: amino acid ABC transporter substrate-binding protein [Hyphomicrobiales bacterium]